MLMSEHINSTRQVTPACVQRKILLVTNSLDEFPNGGRELLCKLNYDVLLDMFGSSFFLFELEKTGVTSFNGFINAFKGHIDGLDAATISQIFLKIRTEKIECLFIDGSNLGALAKQARHEFPELEIITFFHNVETIFFWDSLKHTRSLRAAAVLLVNYLAERKAVSYSNRLICLSERDSGKLNSLFGRQATDISAMAVKDTYTGTVFIEFEDNHDKYALFVGGVFYANLSGVLWYAEHIAPKIQIKTYVVGRGFELYKDKIERWGNIKVIGGVDSLELWYANADFVVAPIFGGSGMKTKVAEALMFGKKVIGTSEAFSGYESISSRVGSICDDADQFIKTIEEVTAIDNNQFDEDLREIYEKNYSIDAARLRLIQIMGESR